MTARAEAPVPASPSSRQCLAEHGDELVQTAGLIDQTRAELRADAQRGLPVEADALRLLAEARDLLIVAARRLDPARAVPCEPPCYPVAPPAGGLPAGTVTR